MRTSRDQGAVLVFEPMTGPDWFHILRLVFAFLLTAGFGIHAYYRHKQESMEQVSPRQWMYWLYAIVLLAVSLANFAQLCITAVFRDYRQASFHLGYSTLLLILSYVALLAGVKRRSFD
jgi:hypothetical protein